MTARKGPSAPERRTHVATSQPDPDPRRNWTTRTGHVIPIKGLTDHHLLAILRMVRRNQPALVRDAIMLNDMRGTFSDASVADFAAAHPLTAVVETLIGEAMARQLDTAAPSCGGGAGPDHSQAFRDVTQMPCCPPAGLLHGQQWVCGVCGRMGESEAPEGPPRLSP